MRSIFTHNLGLKVVSFLIAVAIWYRYSLTSAAGVTQVFERRLKVANKEHHLSVSHPAEDGRVRIAISGRRLDLMQLEGYLSAQVDLKNVKSAIGEVSVPVEAVFPPELSLKVLSVEPKVVKLSVRSAEPGPEPSPAPSPARHPAAGPLD